MLRADFVVRRPQHTTDIDLVVDDGQVVALVGPNGSGKTTTLEAVAGLVAIDEGSIRLDDDVLNDRTVHLPSALRRIGYVFQDALLFPHLSALDNVAFGPRSRGLSMHDSRRRAEEWLERLGIDQLARRKPSALSGGQAQRVAIARALATQPRALLLDEPMSALDATGAMHLRTQLRTHLAGFNGPTVLVTHNAIDAMVLADTIAVLDHGRIVQSGTPSEVASAPRTDHVADLVGINLVRGHARGTKVITDGGAVITVANSMTGDVFATFRPTAVSLYVSPPDGSPRNRWRCTVETVIPHGDAVRVRLVGPITLVADVTPAAVTAMTIRPGTTLWASVKATEVSVYTDQG